MQGEKEGMRAEKSTFPIHSICYTTHLPVALHLQATTSAPRRRRPTCLQPLVRRGGGAPPACNHGALVVTYNVWNNPAYRAHTPFKHHILYLNHANIRH